jgi:hypothetical protein
LSWSGSTFTRTDGTRTGSTVWTQARDASVKINAADHDAHDQDLAAGIQACLKKDGGNSPTANIPMGGFKLTGLPAGTSGTDSAALGQGLLAVTSSGTDTITATLSPAPAAYVSGQRYFFKAGGTNSGATTIEFNSLGAKTVKKMAGGSATALVGGEIVTGGFYAVDYNGTDMILEASPPRVAQVVNFQTGAVNTGITTIPADDTIPQNTEGDQYMSLAITPVNASSTLLIEVEAVLANSAAGASLLTAALFQDSTAGALAAGAVRSTQNNLATVSFRHKMTAGTTSATTFKVRGGGQAAGTTTFNGESGARLFGGVFASSITITEILP